MQICLFPLTPDLGWGAVSYSSLSITQVKMYSSSYLIKRWFPLLNVYLNLTRKQKFTIILDFCQLNFHKMKISSWVDFHLSNTQAWVRNSTPSQLKYPPNHYGPMMTKQKTLYTHTHLNHPPITFPPKFCSLFKYSNMLHLVRSVKHCLGNILLVYWIGFSSTVTFI